MPPETVLHIYCAWCGRHIRDVDGYGETGTSHGICPECAAKEREKLTEWEERNQ